MDGMVGVYVFDTNIELHGPAQEIFKLAETIPVNTFTRVGYNLTLSREVHNVGLCLLETLPEQFEINAARCLELNPSQNVDVAITDLINGKETDINYIGFTQNATFDESSTLSSISIVQGESTSIYDENGCKDPNALTSGSGNSTVCTCKDGFVSSNGGKKQGEYDICVRCILSTYCSFDGQACSSDDDCVTSSCGISKCKARVSWKLVSFKQRNLFLCIMSLTSLHVYKDLPIYILQPSGVANQELGLLVSDAPSSNYTGGSHILPNGTLQVFGDVELLYRFESPITINKFSRLKLSLHTKEMPEQFNLCIFEDKDGADDYVIVGNEYRCLDITNLDNIEINLGSFFEDRMTAVNSITFSQVNRKERSFGESELNNITFVSSTDTHPIFHINGTCKDINAYKIQKAPDNSSDFDMCACGDKFVASNGGIILGENDTCVLCLGCALDGDACVRNRDCLKGTCTNNT